MMQQLLDGLLATAQETPTKKSSRGAAKRDRQRATNAFLQHLIDEHREWSVLHFVSQENEKRGPELQARYPYPGLVNLGDTCYVNAVCQVLFHCDAVRAHLRSGVEDVAAQASPADFADDECAPLVNELQSLARNLVDGFPTDLPGQRCRVDVWSPHALIDAFLRRRPLQLGEQHDAREALEEILTCTCLGNGLFNTGAKGFQRADIVSLPAFAEESPL